MSNNTIEILSSINKSVLQIVNNMSPQNGSDSVANLNRGGQAVVAKPEDNGPNVNVKTDSIKGIVKILSEMSPVIKNIAGLSGRQEKRFKSVIKSVIDAMSELNDAAKKMDVKQATEMVKGMTQLSDAMHTMMKRLVTWIPMAPLALIGATLAIPVFAMVALLFKVIKLIGVDLKTVIAIKSMTMALNAMVGFVLKMVFVSVLMMGLGYFLLNGETGQYILGGLLMFGIVSVMLIGVMLLTGLASKFVKGFAISALKDMVFMVLGMALVLAVFVGFAALVEGHWEYVWQGFGMFALTVISLMGLIFLAGWASRTITNDKAIASLGKIVLVTFAAMSVIVASKYLADFVEANWQDVLLGLASTGLVLLGIVGIAFLANKLKSRALKGTLAMAVIAGLAFAAMGIMFAASKLADEVKGKAGEITLTLLGVSGIILLFAGLAAAASFVAPYITIGGTTLLLIVGFVAATIAVTAGLVGFHKLKEEAGVGWDDIYSDVLGLSGVIGIFGLLTAALGLVSPFVLAGTLACGALVLFTMGASNITKQLITLRTHIANSGTDWDTIMSDLTSLSKVIGLFALVAGAMTLALIPVALGLAAMALTERFAKKAIGLATSVADLGLKIKELGGGDELVNVVKNDMKRLLGTFTYSNLKIPLSIFDIWDLQKQYSAISWLVHSFVKVGSDISRLARIAGVVDEQGRLSPVLKVTDDGKVIYGDPVDIKAVAQLIVDTIKIFTSTLTDGMCSVEEMFSAGIVVRILGSITDPINRFIKMLTGYKSFPNGELAAITMKDDGTIVIGEPVNVAEVGQIIANTVSLFVSTLFSDENVGSWTKILYGEEFTIENWWAARRRRKAISAMTDILSGVVDPIVHLVDLLVTLDAHDDGTVSRVTIKDDGTIVKGAAINLVASGNAVATAIMKTLDAIFGTKNQAAWENIGEWWDDEGEDVKLAITDQIDILSSVVDVFCDEKKDYNAARSNATMIANTLVDIGNTFVGDAFKKGGVFTSGFVNKSLQDIVLTVGSIENIKGEVVTQNGNAIKTFFNAVTPVLKDSAPVLVAFSTSVKMVKDDVYEFDKVLIDEEGKRKKAIDEFKSSMEDLMSVFKDENDTVSSLGTLISSLTYLDKAKVRENADELKKAIKTATNVTPGSGGSGGSGGTGGSGGSGTQTITIDYDKMTDAIKVALDSMTMKKNSTVVDGKVITEEFEFNV